MSQTLIGIIYGSVIGLALAGVFIFALVRDKKNKNDRNNRNLPM